MSDDEEGPQQWVVTAIDAGCDCCSFVAVASFDSRSEAESYIAGTGDRKNYVIEEF